MTAKKPDAPDLMLESLYHKGPLTDPVWCSQCAVGSHGMCGIITQAMKGRPCACAVREHGQTVRRIVRAA